MSDQQDPHQTQQPYGQQPPPGSYPQQGYYQGPPPKKKHTVRNVLLILVLLFVLAVGGCLALLVGAANEADKALNDEAENDKPTAVEEGAAFEHDGFSVAKGWSVSTDAVGDYTLKGVKVTLEDDQGVSGGGRTALLTFRLYNGKSVVSEIECSSKEMQEGESSSMDCFSTDSGKGKWSTIRVADAF